MIELFRYSFIQLFIYALEAGLRFMGNMKRFLAVLLCSFLWINFSFAYDGFFSGEEELFVVKTQWFDIIYQQSSEDAAKILFEKADAVYEDIAGDYGIEPQFRMPVVITSAVEEFNAYWSSYPYNHIVIYDTAAIDDLKVFSESLISTFRHELTHAVSYNLRSPLLQKIDRIFGDPVTPAPLILTSGWAEGATLTNESKNGEGRLNDEYAMHMVKQAKIEGQFPHYADIQGASDLYPFGAFYYFNGAFADYLQKTYGMEKYARFWYLCVNFGGLTAKGIFKKAYGLNLYDVWAEFVESLKIPPLEDIHPSDVCNNNSGAVYSSLTASQKGIAFIEKKSSSVYFIKKGELEKKDPVKLFYNPEVSDIRFSADGNFLLVDVVRENSAAAKKSINIYSLETGLWFCMKESGLQDGCIISNDGKYYLVCHSFISQQNSIKIFSLNFDKSGKKILSASELLKVDFPLDVMPYSFTDTKDGNFAFIKRTGMEQSICLCDLQGNILKEYSAPENRMVMRYLSYDGENLLFSWTKPGSLPRLGKLLLKNSEEDGGEMFFLQDFDVSGGVYWPGAIGGAENLYYIASFYRQNKLFAGQLACVKAVAAGEANSTEELNATEESNSTEKSNSVADSSSPLFAAQKYKPLDYYSQGLLLPFSQVTSASYNPESEVSYPLFWGLTYISSNPWTKGFLTLSAGYGFATNSAGVSAAYSSGTDTSVFNYSVTASSEFDRHFWKQASFDFNVSSILPFGNISYIIFSNDIFAHYGRSNKTADENEVYKIGYLASDDMANYFYANDTFSVTYTNVHKAGPGRYEKVGIKASALCSYILNARNIPFKEVYQNGGQAGFYTSAYIPKLLPVENLFRYTYNLPSKISLYLFARQNKVYSLVEDYLSMDVSRLTTSNLPVYTAASIQTETILFGYDIQKAIPGIRALFANDFNVSFVYTGGFITPDDLYKQNWKFFHLNDFISRIQAKEMNYSYYLSLKSSIGLTPNFGGLASSSNKMMIFAQISWLSSNKLVFDCGLDVSF